LDPVSFVPTSFNLPRLELGYGIFLVVRIRAGPLASIADPGCLSRIQISSIPDPGSKRFPDLASASKNLSILTQKIVFKLSEI
jgi:hypothetical protein